MIASLAAVLLAAAASAAAPAAPAAPGRPMPPGMVLPAASTAPAAMPLSLGPSTFTVSSLYTGDRVRDPFLPPAAGGKPVRKRDPNAVFTVDIHALQLRGIMTDAASEFALFSAEDGTALILRGGRLYYDRNKVVAGITGRIRIKQKRAELVTADKDVQIYSLGEAAEDGKDADKDRAPDDSRAGERRRSP
jgi:hypothetical protein